MMEALGEAQPASMESLITEDSIVKALRNILPSINTDTATMKVVMQKLAVRFGMEFADLKAQWRARIKALLPDMLELCGSGDVSKIDSEKDDADVHQDEEEEAFGLRPRRKRTGTKRNVVVDASNEESRRRKIVDDSEASEGDAAKSEAGDGEDDADDDDPASVKERRKAIRVLPPDSSHKKKRKSKRVVPPLKRSKTTKQPDSAGLTSLKELGRAAGVLNPRLYKLLNSAASTADAEEILRDRLHDAGISFAGSYPSSREISAAKRKRMKEKDLEGIDTSLIISGRRSRRGASQRNYKEECFSGVEDNAEEEEHADDDKEDTCAEGSAVSDSDSSEASF